MKEVVRKQKGYWMFKAPMELKTQIDRIRLERIRQKKDNELRSYNRIGLAISRHTKLLDDLIKADLIDGDYK